MGEAEAPAVIVAARSVASPQGESLRPVVTEVGFKADEEMAALEVTGAAEVEDEVTRYKSTCKLFSSPSKYS